MTTEQLIVCERIRRLGYARNNQIRLYGEVFELISDPVSMGENLVFVDALERGSERLRRIRLPLNIVHMAIQEVRAA